MAFVNYKDKNFEENVFLRFFSRRLVSGVILTTVFFCVIFLNTIAVLSPEKYELEIGQKSPVDLIAPRDLEDKIATERLIKRAIELVEPREKIDPTIQIGIKKKIEKFFTSVHEIRGQQDLTYEEKLALQKQFNDLNLSESELILILAASDKALKSIESYIYEMVTQIMSTGIKGEELEKEKANITNYFMSLNEFPEEMRLLGIHIVNSSLKPNRFLDVETTQQKIDEAKQNVEKVVIKKGSLIIGAGEVINLDKLQLLKDAGFIKEEKNNNLPLYLGIGMLTLAIEVIIIAYIYVFNRELFYKPSKLYLILIVFLSVYLPAKTMFQVFSPFLVPVAAVAMIIAILVDARLAILVNLILSVFVTMVTGNSIEFLVISLVSGTVGAFCMTHSHQRGNVFIAGLAVSISNSFIILGFDLINSTELSKMLTESFIGILNGILCAVLTIGSLPLWEAVFGILTPFKLLELSNPNHPILKKLLLEAPGTYHHSIIVGNLSESAADAIGANGLFARVSSYYHDIGKLKRPYFFKENQLSSENPHEKLTASLSALIITSHVKDGIEIARQYKVPKEIIDVIEQHHGTTLVKYFYHKALTSEEENNSIQEENYRYSAVKPQTRESAIVMLADSVEAAVRSMAEHSEEKIKKLIGKIMEDKLADHQLDDCDLTLKDLEKISESFRTVLLGIYHERIEYPELNPKTVEVAE